MKNEIWIDSENHYQVVVLLIEIEIEVEIEIENPNTIEMLLIAIRRPTESWGPGQIWNWPQLSS